jgi:hypothetical protein
MLISLVNTNSWGIMKIKPLVALVAILSLTGCAGASSPTPTVTVTETVTAEPAVDDDQTGAANDEGEVSEASTDGIFGVGETASNFGVELTIDKAYLAKTVPLNKSNYRQGSGYETYSDEKPAKGGKFLVVKTTVKNAGKKSMDLTCGYPIAIKAGDTENRAYDTIESLYEYKGNPECNSDLQPGFKNKMTYVFMAPEDAELTGLVFQDTNNDDYNDYTGVRFDKPLK